MAVPAPVTLVGLRLQATLSADRLTVPVKPLTAATVIVDVPAEPELTATLVGLADIVKSGAAAGLTLIVTVTE